MTTNKPLTGRETMYEGFPSSAAADVLGVLPLPRRRKPVELRIAMFIDCGGTSLLPPITPVNRARLAFQSIAESIGNGLLGKW